MVNAAGSYDRVPLHGRGPDEVARVLDDNLIGFANVLAVLLRAHRAFRLVAVGSQAAVSGGTDAVYAAAKAGQTALVKSLALVYAEDGLRANVVSPGPVNTRMADVMGARRGHYEQTIPIRRFAEAAEVAAAVLWLALDAPDAVTGTVLDIDGGLARR